MKILVLHGFGQSSALVQQRGKNIFKLLAKNNTLFFPQGPHAVQLEKDSISSPGQCWFYYDEANPSYFAPYLEQDEANWRGLEQSLQYLKYYETEHGPFDIILGFSQGGQMATIATLELENIKAVIIMSSFIRPKPLNYQLQKIPIHIKSMHIMGKEDNFISNDKSRELANLYYEPQVLIHHKGHTIAQHAEIKTRIREFLAELGI